MSDIVLHKVGVKFEPSKIGLEYTNGNDGISSFFLIVIDETKLYEVELNVNTLKTADSIYEMLIREHDQYFSPNMITKDQVF